jgi:hypothetical protein
VLGDEERRALHCECGAWSRPHVLWFDESYDEELFRARSALSAAEDADLLVVVGTSGQTNLPFQIVQRVAGLGRPILVVNVDENPFSRAGIFLRGRATDLVPAIAGRLSPHCHSHRKPPKFATEGPRPVSLDSGPCFAGAKLERLTAPSPRRDVEVLGGSAGLRPASVQERRAVPSRPEAGAPPRFRDHAVP